MSAEMIPTVLPLPPAVLELARGRGLEITVGPALPGGIQSLTRRLHLRRLGGCGGGGGAGESWVLKQCPHAPPAMFQKEARGLQLLASGPGPRTPRVLLQGEDFLLLEDLGNCLPRAANFWENLGRELGALHRRTAPAFGLEYDNYLGILPQYNPRMADGRAFFLEHRVLRYVREPLCQKHMTAEDRRMLDRICARFESLVPPQPPALCHGDFWFANVVTGPEGEGCLIDPAVHYGLAEADLALIRLWEPAPEAFFSAYVEANPLPDGWQERWELFCLKEFYAIAAQFGNEHGTIEDARAVLRKFA